VTVWTWKCVLCHPHVCLAGGTGKQYDAKNANRHMKSAHP